MTSRSRNIQPCHITWQGISIAVTYEPDWLDMEQHDLLVAHLTVQAENRQRLPFTETGYRSHFLHPDSVEAAGGPAVFVLAWLDEAAGSAEWKRCVEANRQLALF